MKAIKNFFVLFLFSLCFVGMIDAAPVSSQLASRQISISEDEEEEAPPLYWGLCFTAKEPNATVSMAKNGNPPNISLVYTTDAEEWLPFVPGETLITLPSRGSRVYLAAGASGNTRLASGYASNYHYFVLTNKVAASGSISSLLNANTDIKKYTGTITFASLFRNCKTLVSAPELPATDLSSSYYCYYYMFAGCTSLTIPPELPATKLHSAGCYMAMFSGCSSLKRCPELPATANAYYSSMFEGCTSLEIGPSTLPATSGGYSAMFANCSKMTKGPKEISVISFNGDGMFSGCSSLQVAPEIKATRLTGNYAMASMFARCSSLIEPPIWHNASNVTITTGSAPFAQMFEYCTSLKSSIPLVVTNNLPYMGCYRMFHDCNALTNAPQILSKQIGQSGCNSMFLNCSSLATPAIFQDATLASGAYSSIYNGCKNIPYVVSYAVTPPTIDSGTFNGVPTTIPVYVPEESIDAYKAAANWSRFTNYQPLENAP